MFYYNKRLLEALVRTQYMVKEFLVDADYEKHGVPIPPKTNITGTKTTTRGTKVVSSKKISSSLPIRPTTTGKSLNPRKRK
jgi:hypothetical protein